MAAHDYRTRVDAYQAAIAGLYARPAAVLTERGGTATIGSAPAAELDARAQAVVDRSRELGEAAAATLASPDAEAREVAELQLLAAAAVDLHVASDLARLAEPAGAREVVERGPGLPTVLADLQGILRADPARGMAPLVGALRERGAGPADPRAAREALGTAADDAITDIRDDAAAIGGDVVTRLVELPLPVLQEAVNAVISEVMSRLSDSVAALLRKAVALVAQAVDKLLAALGKDARDAARKKVGEWIEQLKKGTLLTDLLDRLYESARIRQDVRAQVAGSPAALAAARFNGASERVAELAQRFRKQKQVITWVLRGLSAARPWIIPVEPWGTVGLGAAYVTTLAYVVYLAGDYIDWYRVDGSERLNFVPGVRTIVARELAEP